MRMYRTVFSVGMLMLIALPLTAYAGKVYGSTISGLTWPAGPLQAGQSIGVSGQLIGYGSGARERNPLKNTTVSLMCYDASSNIVLQDWKTNTDGDGLFSFSVGLPTFDRFKGKYPKARIEIRYLGRKDVRPYTAARILTIKK